MRRRLRILVWHVHGTYLNSLVQAPHDFYLPVKEGRPDGYVGRGPTFVWPDNAVDVPAEEVRNLELDLVLYQTRRNWEHDQFEILSDAQRRVPRIYLEHDPPRDNPTEQRHCVADEQNLLLVHVTHFNRLMWDSGACPTEVIEHGILPRPHLRYRGRLERGVTVVNNIHRRSRRTGFDLWQRASEAIPLDLMGMGSEEVGGLGDFPQADALERIVDYRFFFNPIRYTSMPMAVCEAMMLGLPIVAFATTDLPNVIVDGHSGFISTNPDRLIEAMRILLRDPSEAGRLGANARAVALERFNVERFVRDWDRVFRLVAT